VPFGFIRDPKEASKLQDNDSSDQLTNLTSEIKAYLDIIVPTRPLLAPPVIMQRLPVSNLMVSWILPVAMSTWTLS